MTEHPIARDNVIDNEYRYTALDGIYLPAADSDRIGHNEYDCRCHNAPGEAAEGRAKEDSLHRIADRYRESYSIETSNIRGINIDKKIAVPKISNQKYAVLLLIFLIATKKFFFLCQRKKKLINYFALYVIL